MSRFGIRKKLKGLLSNPQPEIVRHQVTFILPDGVERSFQIEEHYSLLMAADTNDITISTGRRAGGTCPDGLCGLCRVELVDDTGISAMTDYEKKTMDDHVAGTPHEGRARKPGPPLTPRTRLGCHSKIVGSGGKVQILALFDPDTISGDSADA